LAITDTEGEGFTQDFSCEYRDGDTPAQKVGEIKDKMNEAITIYKRHQVILKSAALNNAVAAISGGLSL
jgi:hypothetical protein